MTTGDFWNYGFGPMDDLLARFFGGSVLPLRLFIGALIPTLIAAIAFRLL